MNKEQVIASIKQRILDEHRKHKSLDWVEIAARKIYNTHLVKEKCNLPIVSNMLCGSFEPDNKTSSATKCKCGREKWEHPKAT